ncbi:hypothetical protein NQ315_014503 [Exocentrus adspersus]|uniref:Tyr recombinase domain-containing protein n=1 Tax=Exocentrus adspersus TaxID=1586481 RepID=A0AAV8V7Y3_9CUCU|nr:hypothetical protein NQ315_014503 [Exocentrus adspersus]
MAAVENTFLLLAKDIRVNKKTKCSENMKLQYDFNVHSLLHFMLPTGCLKFKVGMIFGVAGACRREELYNLKIEDIEESDRIMIVKLPQTKTHIQRSFVIINEPNEKVDHMDIYHKYLNLRPSNAKSSHLFLNYRNGKCTNQVIGKGTIGRWPSKIAEYLSL